MKDLTPEDLAKMVGFGVFIIITWILSAIIMICLAMISLIFETIASILVLIYTI
ncbi:hypothetical protein [Bathymodiolus platifrons methanotrophic gill symbiont]|uniref:hypothetical protein n=1 Tax=Bathymodiolus platifrons methanotrophic gill symbiont TaxID=113268 RepID=UPI001C8EA790|nr:hypothetical protein [Bathymodiolus platifrons methanotrophic gill symbiont]